MGYEIPSDHHTGGPVTKVAEEERYIHDGRAKDEHASKEAQRARESMFKGDAPQPAPQRNFIGQPKPQPTLEQLEAERAAQANAARGQSLQFMPALNALSTLLHTANQRWWYDLKTGERLDRNKGELLCLVHSEISEALEGERKNKMDDHLPHRRSAEVELADALIRIFDYAGAYGYDLAGAVCEKVLYNASRADHKKEARLADNGKKF